MSTIWKDGLYGLIVGDALGVPVEFTSREARIKDPVVDMRAFGTHNQPTGTWSDDTSMTLATLASIRKLERIDYKDIMDNFADWYLDAKFTPFDDVFDIGIATTKAIRKYIDGIAPVEAGGASEWDNGNGSLMRILPVCLFLYEKQKKVCTSEDENIYVIHNVSALTHAHLRSQIACGIYYFLVKAVLEKDGEIQNRIQQGINDAYEYYRRDREAYKELSYYDRLMDIDKFKKLPESQIKSSGYVVDSLEAAIWCILNTDSYKSAVLKAVNLGEDTDTVGEIAGGLAGLIYGFDSIPAEWVSAIQRRDFIESMGV